MYENVADLYESEFSAWKDDLYFYLKFLPPASKVLELGSGTGRLTVPLSAHGHSVTGIELSGPMTDRARQAVSETPREIQSKIQFVPGDFAHPKLFHFPEKFDAVLAPFSAINFLLDSRRQADCLAELADLLHPRGKLLIDLVHAKPAFGGGEKKSTKTFSHLKRGTVIEKSAQEFRASGGSSKILSIRQKYEEKNYLDGSLIDRKENEIRIYLFEPNEILGILESAGFSIEEVWGNYSGEPFQEAASPRMLIASSLNSRS
ncbi:MAG: class I SAM-dependent methyltransferase [Candidatus Omnitrophica bacterium]|nr:class I SAM-dependent methyltransferase [Candidatus Omnitrophota bacterium]